MSTIHSIGIVGAIVTPSSDRYDESISRISATSVLRPSYVVYPATDSDITLALEYARSQSPPLSIAVKGGGCHTSTVSSSEGGMVIDLSALKSVSVSSDQGTVAVGGGAVWGDVYSELAKHDLVVVGGSVWYVRNLVTSIGKMMTYRCETGSLGSVGLQPTQDGRVYQDITGWPLTILSVLRSY